MRHYDLNGKVALVTGAGRGIGFETARQLHHRGASVAVVDIDADAAEDAAGRIGDRAIGFAADVTDRGAVSDAVAETVERFGGLDIAVANAGVMQSKVATMRDIKAEEWERVVEVNLLGVWRTVRAALPQVVARRGQVVVISSIGVLLNGMGSSPYAATKAAIESLGRSLRVELAPFGASATVAFFGWVDTKLVRDLFDQPAAERYVTLTPDFLLKRITPEEAAAGLIRAIERRSPRVFVPKWWRYVFALRGLIVPLFDRYLERHRGIGELLRDVDAEAGASEITSSVPGNAQERRGRPD